MTDIHKPNKGYDVLHFLVNRAVKKSYRTIQVRGLENIPTDGAVILAANHCNTLMDALVVLRARGMKITVFGARADLYNNPTVGKIVRFLRILPMVRERDGIRNVVKNFDTMDQIADVIGDKVPFCFYPEGTHRPKHSLLPIRKGLTRVVMTADEKLPADMPIYMVPVGIEYGDYFRFHSSNLVTFGKPVELRSTVRSTEDKNMQFFKSMSELYTEKISELITYIPDDENYDGLWSLTKILRSGNGVISQAFTDTPAVNLDLNRKEVAEIQKKMVSNPDGMASLLQKAADFETKRKSAHISTYSFFAKHQLLNVLARFVTAVVCLCLWCLFAVFSLPTWITAKILCAKVFKDRCFHNTGRTVCNFLINPLQTLAWLLVGLFCCGWWTALIFGLLSIMSYRRLWDCCGVIRRSVSDFRLLFNGELRQDWTDMRKTFSTI